MDINFFESMKIVMEADDITEQTTNEVRGALGGRNLSTQRDEGGDDLENTNDIFNQTRTKKDNTDDDIGDNATEDDQNEDIENTDDIFGNNENTDGDPSGNPEEDQTNGENEEGSDDPNLDAPQGEDDMLGESEDAPNVNFTKKNAVRDNMIHLHSMISSNIETLVSAISNVNEINSLKVMNAVLLHLRNAKKYLYNTLTVGIGDLEYDELLRRYITIKHVYDICIRMLETHFKINEKK